MKITRNEAIEVLQVEESASASEIKKAYYRLAQEWHPDKRSEEEKEEATEKFQMICAAYQRLIRDEDSEDEDDDYDFDFGLAELFAFFSFMEERMGGRGQHRGGGGGGGGFHFGAAPGGFFFSPGFPMGGFGFSMDDDDYSDEDDENYSGDGDYAYMSRDERRWREQEDRRQERAFMRARTEERGRQQRDAERERVAALQAAQAEEKRANRWLTRLPRPSQVSRSDTGFVICVDGKGGSSRRVQMGGAIPDGYFWELQMKQVPRKGTKQIEDWAYVELDAKRLEAKVEGLKPGSKYLFRARTCLMAKDECGRNLLYRSDWSLEADFMTTGCAAEEQKQEPQTEAPSGQGKKARRRAAAEARAAQEAALEAAAAAAAEEARLLEEERSKAIEAALAAAAAAADYETAKAEVQAKQSKGIPAASTSGAAKGPATPANSTAPVSQTTQGGGKAGKKKKKKNKKPAAAPPAPAAAQFGYSGSGVDRTRTSSSGLGRDSSDHVPPSAQQPAMLPPTSRAQVASGAFAPAGASRFQDIATAHGMTVQEYIMWREEQDVLEAIQRSLVEEEDDFVIPEELLAYSYNNHSSAPQASPGSYTPRNTPAVHDRQVSPPKPYSNHRGHNTDPAPGPASGRVKPYYAPVPISTPTAGPPLPSQVPAPSSFSLHTGSTQHASAGHAAGSYGSGYGTSGNGGGYRGQNGGQVGGAGGASNGHGGNGNGDVEDLMPFLFSGLS